MDNDFYYRVNDRDGRLKTVQLTIPNVTKINNYLEDEEKKMKKIIPKIAESINGFNRILKDVLYKDAFSTEEYGNIVNKLESVINETDIYSLFDFNFISNVTFVKLKLCTVAKEKREKLCDVADTEVKRQMGLMYNELGDLKEDDDMFQYYEKKYDQMRIERDTVIPTARRGFYDK